MSKLDDLISELCPNGVKYKTLGEISSLITKGTTPTSVGYSFQKEGVSFVKIESITNDGAFLKEKFEHISNECNKKLNRSILKENDILFSIAGALGRIAVVTKDILPANTNQALALIRLEDNDINVKYIFYVLQTTKIKGQFESQQTGSAQSNLSLRNISDLLVPLPPLPVQHEIVHILDDFTQRTKELISELAAELTARKQQYEYYRNVLLTFDNLEAHNFTDRQTDRQTDQWRTLGEVSIKTYSGGTPLANNAEYYGGDIPWLRTQEVRFVDIYDTEMRITSAALKKSSIAMFFIG